VLGDAPEHLVGRLDHDPTVARQIASAEHRETVVGERRKHVRTVRSAAWSRNRPRRRLAWLLLLVLLVLIALATRLDAAPGGDDVLTGARADATRVSGGDDDDEADEAAERAAEIEGEDAGEGDDATDRDLVELTGELDRLDPAPGDASEDPLADTDLGTPASLAAAEDDAPDAPLTDAGTGTLAMLDAELDPSDPIAVVDAADAAAPAGAAEAYDQSLRRRPSPWGRLDVGVAWRSRWSEPMHSPPNHTGELWLVATWRR
jgi:hypothetical protein